MGEEEVEVDVLDIGPSVGGGEESVEGGVLGEVRVTGGGVYPGIVEGVIQGSQEAVVSLGGFTKQAVFGFADAIEPTHLVGIDFVVQE